MEHKESKNGHSEGCWYCSPHGVHGPHGKWSLFRIVVALIILYIVFWTGFKFGEIKAFLGYGMIGYGGMMGGSYYGYPQSMMGSYGATPNSQYGPGSWIMRQWGCPWAYNAGGPTSTTTRPNNY